MKPIRAPRGTRLSCRSWQTEAPYRMIQNNLDPEVAEDPSRLVVYGGSGKAAQNWPAFHAILRTLKDLKEDETLIVQSGKPVAVFRTFPSAPRVLIANSNLVPHWATWDHFRDLEAKGLMMFGQMTAGSWIYIGSQGILQGTYETFAAAGVRHFGGSLSGRVILSGGLGGMGGAQPLAATMAGAVFLGIDVDRDRIEKRLKTRYLDKATSDLDEALEWVDQARKAKAPLSVGLVGNCAEVLPELLRRNFQADLVTDQTSAHDALNGYVPTGRLPRDPKEYVKRSMAAMRRHCEAMVEFQKRGSVVFDYGNNLRGQALLAGFKKAFSYPGFVPAYVRELFCEGRGPFRWVALSGDERDIAVTDDLVLKMFPRNEHLCRWIRMARDKVAFQGLPARICWLGQGERAEFGEAMNRLVAKGTLRAPIVIGRDHLDTGSVASPNRETEAMKDGSDAVADWPLLNALLNTASGATWVSIHHGGGVGIGYAIHAGQVICADGTKAMGERLNRVLTNDPGLGIARHADAGYAMAWKTARAKRIRIPMGGQA